MTKNESGISKTFFNQYFKGKKYAYVYKKYLINKKNSKIMGLNLLLNHLFIYSPFYLTPYRKPVLIGFTNDE